MQSSQHKWNDEGRRPTFTNPDAIVAEPSGWYRNKGHRRRPGVVRGRRPRLTDGRKHVVTVIKQENPASQLRPFNDYVTAWLRGLISQAELDTMANFYGELGYKVVNTRQG